MYDSASIPSYNYSKNTLKVGWSSEDQGWNAQPTILGSKDCIGFVTLVMSYFVLCL